MRLILTLALCALASCQGLMPKVERAQEDFLAIQRAIDDAQAVAQAAMDAAGRAIVTANGAADEAKKEEPVSPLQAGGAAAAASGLIAWLLDRRQEKKLRGAVS